MNKWPALLLALCALALPLAGCGGDDDDDGGGNGGATTSQQDTAPAGGGAEDPGGEGQVVKVEIGDNFFEPKDAKVKAGATVEWTNEGNLPHTVTKEDGPGGEFDSGNVEPGGKFEETFDSPGKIAYVCEIHPGQSGTLTVE